MPEWSPERTVDEALARRLISAQHFTPSSLTLIGEGWDNTVWLVDGRYAFRFPRREMAIPGVVRELDVLPQLRLPLPVPTPVFVGEPTDEFAWPWFGAELIVGREPLGLSEDERNAVGRPLGEFLRALHDSTVSSPLPDDPMGRADMGIRVARTIESVQALGRKPPGWLSDARRLERPPATAVCHGDLHLRHVLVRDGAMAGVIDWGDVCVGDPSIDLILLWCLLGPDGRSDFFRAYGRITEEQLLRAQVLALNLCAVLAVYAAEEGMSDLCDEALAGYERASRAL
ncbi:phosphotransferase [Solirubrobacter sp. CPCC 204708]|uniref:Phosphotransferase n=1 Tax=Solirubrobacter deserti TaxID=2282478 RepID=A0ABT4RCT7_9ACTN|nr:phosphotransferase [Solirubrobacter deserti]MBE2317885.1 phosphotransferase [Solirubrobacter deserti]MDA0136338.1 phosphotransferase [Solirubrobacter deserti]